MKFFRKKNRRKVVRTPSKVEREEEPIEGLIPPEPDPAPPSRSPDAPKRSAVGTDIYHVPTGNRIPKRRRNSRGNS